MKNKIIIVIIFLILGTFLVALQVKNIFAGKSMDLRKELISRIDSGEIAAPFLPIEITPTVFPEGGMGDLPTVEDRILQVSSEQVAKNEFILESARELIKKANETYRTPGWWHVAYQVNHLVPEGTFGTMPNGHPMPTEWREDHWILVDEKGFIIQSIDIVDSGTPETSQVGVYNNGIAKNFAFGDSWDESPQLASLGDGFLQLTEADIKTMALESHDDVLGDEPVIVYTSKRTASKPLEMMPGYWVSGGINVRYYSKGTGFSLLFEVYDILPDGQIKLKQRVSTLVIEKIIGPPAEVIEYLR